MPHIYSKHSALTGAMQLDWRKAELFSDVSVLQLPRVLELRAQREGTGKNNAYNEFVLSWSTHART